MDDLFHELMRRSLISPVLETIADCLPQVVEEALTFQSIAAPTFHERERGEALCARLAKFGLQDVEQDELDNVFARTPGQDPEAPAVMVSAHMDTVFPPGTNLIARREQNTVHAPGIGDNGLGLAALTTLANLVSTHNLSPAADLWWVGTVGEEGLGNLRGMRRAMKRLRERVGLVIVIEGTALGRVYHAGLSVQRLRISVSGPGGHSWLNHGRPSAIHHLTRIGEAILSHVEVPISPRSSLNIGLIEGGTAVNTIAANASLTLDLRSEDPATLQTLAEHVTTAVDPYRNIPDLGVTVSVVGERPGAVLPREHPLPQAAITALQAVGETQVHFDIGSTDANIPLAMGVPAICVGVTRGGNAHRVDEFIEIPPIVTGLQALLLIVLAAAEHIHEWQRWDAGTMHR